MKSHFVKKTMGEIRNLNCFEIEICDKRGDANKLGQRESLDSESLFPTC